MRERQVRRALSGGVAARYVAGASLADPKAEALLARYEAHPRVVGIREILSWHPDPERRFIEQRDRMDDRAWRRGLARLAGHGLSFDTVGPVAAIPTIHELNIGHFLIGEAIFSGLDSAIKRMRSLMDKARAEAIGERSA